VFLNSVTTKSPYQQSGNTINGKFEVLEQSPQKFEVLKKFKNFNSFRIAKI